METSYLVQDADHRVAMEIKTSKGNVVTEYMEMEKPNNTTSKTTTNVYKVTYWAGDGEKLEFAPKSDVLLFEPNTFTATMKAGECAKELVRFKGIVGKFIEGQISPPLPNIDILISSNGSEGISIKTDQTGKYRYGPVHPDFEYKISAS
uniref:Carboxypeptidase regulatory-like domain-containing protein n=1 Tax=Ciona savignyi TaxID=51511 RepID=H2ZM51_CIOSA